MGAIRSIGGASGGGGSTGHLRWGPNYGNDEQHNFGALASIAAAEYRQVVDDELDSQAAIQMFGAISAQLGMTAQEQLDIFFTLVFLYTLVAQGVIALSALNEIGLLLEQTVISYAPKMAWTLQNVAAITEPALTGTGLIVAAGALLGAYKLLYSALVAQGTLSGSYAAVMPAEQVSGTVKMPALALDGLAQAAASASLVAMQEAGTLAAQGTFGATYKVFYVTAGTRTLTVPAGVTALKCEAWGGGGGGGAAGGTGGGGGGGSGAYSRVNALAVTPGDSITVIVGVGGSGANGGSSSIKNTSTCLAQPGGVGLAGSGTNQGAGGGGGAASSGVGDFKTSGANGGGGGSLTTNGGGGGGGAGANGDNTGGQSNGTHGNGDSYDASLSIFTNGNGGNGASGTTAATKGVVPGGGGGGASTLAAKADGAAGMAVITMVV